MALYQRKPQPSQLLPVFYQSALPRYSPFGLLRLLGMWAELQAIKVALSHIETSNEVRWTIFSDSQASIQALTQQVPKNQLLKLNPDHHDLTADPKQSSQSYWY